MKRVGKTSRPFKYDLHQTPYDYTVEVINTFNGLDLVDREPEELWMEVHNTIWGQWPKPFQRQKCKKAKWLSEEVLQRAKEKRETKGKG